VVNGQGCGIGPAVCHGAAEECCRRWTVKIDVFQSFRAFPILRGHFEHHVILIQLGVDDGHFRLSECAIQRRVQRLRGDAEFGRCDAVIVHQLIQAAILLVRTYILQTGQVLHRTQDDRRPLGKILHIVRLERVLVHRIAGPAADAEILHSLEECRSHRQMVQFRAQAADDLSGADLALRQWLERDVEGSVIGGPAAAGKRNHVGDRRVILDYAPICRMESFIAGKDESCGPRTLP
jgi:hypothetical protein